MTLRTTVNEVGVVAIVKVESEFVSTPPRYTCDCTECGWGYFSADDQVVAEMEAQAHLGRKHELYDEYDDVEDGEQTEL